jgi:hypothetical protein
MPERASINQRPQFGVETTSGTSVAANKSLSCFDLVMGIKPTTVMYRGTGHRWPTIQAENKEWTEIDLSGDLDYQGMVYILSSIWGGATITLHTGGTLSHDWVWIPPISGSITPKTYTIEQGDSVRAQKVNYGLVHSFGYKGTRDGFNMTAAMIGQLFQDAITMTATPTAIALSPVVGEQVNIYIDPTAANVGVTQYLRFLDIEYKYDNGFGPFWALNRANTSWTGAVDTVPTNTVKMLLEADAQGMGLLPSLRSGATLYLRVDAVGLIIEGAIPYAFQHDVAIKLTNVDKFQDKEGLYAIGFEGVVVEDAAWGSGQSQKATLTNVLTAL